MPACACQYHDTVSNGECRPVFKISNKKIKKETVAKFRNECLIGKYDNFLCQGCVEWMENGGPSRGVKRELDSEPGILDNIIEQICSGVMSEDNLIVLAAAIGDRICDNIFTDSENVSAQYKDPNNVLDYDISEWLDKRNKVLVSFLKHSAKCSGGINGNKQSYVTSAVECVYKARNLKTVTPLAFSCNLVSYYLSHSRTVVSLMNSCRPAGSYTTLKNWLGNTAPNIAMRSNKNDCITFFDNSQVIARNWRVNYNYKCQASVITTTAHINVDSCIQQDPLLSPRMWLYCNKEENDTTAKVKEFICHHQTEYKKIRNEYLCNRLQEAEKLEGNLENMSSKKESKDPYEWVPSHHLNPQPDISIGEPVMVNPCSYRSVETVLKEIQKSTKVDGTEKSWCVIGCDGLPYTLGSKLIERNQDLQNVLLIPGQGHIEMNVVKAMFKILWEPVLKDLSQECGFKSPRAQICAQTCSDHHKSFMLLRIFFESALQEIFHSFFTYAKINSLQPSLNNFYTFIGHSQDKNFRFTCDILINYLLPIIIFRAGIRRNNFNYIWAGKAQFMKLFFAYDTKNYQQLMVKDITAYVLAPPDVKRLIERTMSFTVSGHQSKGEGGDFVLEAMNGRIKKWLPPGIPTNEHWQMVCRNSDMLQKIKDQTFKSCNLSEDSPAVYQRDISEEVALYGSRIRRLGYLSNNLTKENPHTLINGQLLDKTLHLFENQLQKNEDSFFRNKKEEFIPIFTTELQRTTFYSIERKTKKQLIEIIQQGISDIEENGDLQEALVLRNMWVNIKTRTKLEMIAFYKEVITALENSTGPPTLDEETCDEDTCIMQTEDE